MLKYVNQIRYFFFILLFLFFNIGNSFAKEYHPLTCSPQKEIHIYVLTEFQPTLFMVADILTKPDDVKKVVINSIFPKDFGHNITEIDLPLETETAIQNAYLYDLKAIAKLQSIYNKNKDADYYIHTGVFMSLTRLIPILQIIPEDRIKQIHLYESNVGRVLAQNNFLWNDRYIFSPSELRTCIKYNCLKTYEHIFTVHALYPTTYHLGFLDKIQNDPQLSSFLNRVEGSHLENMSFETLKTTLTDEQKEELYKVYNFDIASYRKLTKGKKVNIFIVGHGVEEIKDSKDKIITAIKDWYQRNKGKKDELLFIKVGRQKSLIKDLEANGINVPIFPLSGPFELLIIADLLPDSVSGTSSAIFFSLPNQSIDKIYKMKSNPHLPLMLKLNKIDKSQIVDLK